MTNHHMNLRIIFVTKICFIVIAGVLSSSTKLIAQESPLECSIQRQYSTHVKCSIVEDRVKIGKVTVNRGNCRSPSLSDVDYKFLLNLSESEMMTLESELDHYLPDYPRWRELCGTGSPWPSENFPIKPGVAASKIKKFTAICSYANDPRAQGFDTSGKKGQDFTEDNNFKFGDTFIFHVPKCDNFLEYSIEANDEEWIFRAR